MEWLSLNFTAQKHKMTILIYINECCCCCCCCSFLCACVFASVIWGDMIENYELIQFNTMKNMQLRFYRQCYLCGFVNFNLFYVIKFKLNLLFNSSFSFQLYETRNEMEGQNGRVHNNWVSEIIECIVRCNVQFIKWKLQLEFDTDSYQRAFIYKWCCCFQIRYVCIFQIYLLRDWREWKSAIAQHTAHGDFNWF